MKTSLVIVGAGIIGTAIARELASRGVAATLIDDRPVGGGATRASAGMLAPYVEAHDAGPLRDLGIRSLDLYDEWIAGLRRDSGIDVEYRRIGTLEVAPDPEQAAELRRRARPSGVGGALLWLDPQAARHAHPALGATSGALFCPAHGYVAAPQLAAALAQAAQGRGTTLLRATVQTITPHAGALRVTTSDGEITADTLVLAAGAWTNRIAGVALPPLRPVRGQLLQLRWPGDPLSTIIWGPGCYVVPRTDGTVLVGATVEEAGFDEYTTAAGVRDLLEATGHMLPDSWRAPFLDARAGLRPATPDSLPVLGPDPNVPGLVHASGHYRNGVLLAPITGRVIADWIVDGTRDPVFETLRPDRF